MKKILHILLIGLLLAGNAFAAGWITYKPDRSIKARGESEFQDGRILKTRVFDSEGRAEFVIYPIYNESGKVIGQKRTLPNDEPWPYQYVVYGGAALGGIDKLAEDIKMIEAEITKRDSSPILEILFLSGEEVEVMTGVIKGPLNGSGQYHGLKKEGASWRKSDPKGSARLWVS